MESQEKQAKNLQFCIAKLRNFVDIIPKEDGGNVNWEELNQHRDLAEMSLTHLASILGGDPDSGNTSINMECLCYPKI